MFPELCLSGYAIDDLVMQDALLDGVASAIERIVAASVDLFPVLVVGAPLHHRNRLYNCAVVIHRGEVLGVVPKAYLPTYREFYERRWYAPGEAWSGEAIRIGALETVIGTNLLFEARDVEGLTLHVEVCEDMWVPVPPSSRAALAGASGCGSWRWRRSTSRATPTSCGTTRASTSAGCASRCTGTRGATWRTRRGRSTSRTWRSARPERRPTRTQARRSQPS